MSRLFGKLKLSWPAILIFAAVAGIYTGFVMIIPFLQDTSFQDIGISYEWWVIFAVIIVVNCEKNWEAMLKCFVFFLISQPFVYMVQVYTGNMELSTAAGYYVYIWLPITFLTLPGGFIAYYCKKQSLLGAIILGLGNSIQCLMGLSYTTIAISDFPHHLLSAIVSFGSIGVFIFCIQKRIRYRMIAFLVPIVMMLLLLLFLNATGRVLY